MPPDQNSKANSTTQEPTKLSRAEYTCALWNYNYRRNHQPIKGNSECWKKERKKKKKRERNKKQKRNTRLNNQQKGWAEPGHYCPAGLYTSVQQLEQLSNSVPSSALDVLVDYSTSSPMFRGLVFGMVRRRFQNDCQLIISAADIFPN